jgi:hypothetical protein
LRQRAERRSAPRGGFAVLVAVLVAVASLCARLVAAQPSEGTIPLDAVCLRDATAGSAAERTLLLRALAIGVATAPRPHLRHGLDTARVQGTARRCGGRWTGPAVTLFYSTDRAALDRDGGVWQGRGFTANVSGGGVAAWRGLSAAVRPSVTFAENRAYRPLGGSPSATEFRDPADGSRIDMPYRFGGSSVAMLDPGESFVRFDAGPSGFGVTTEAQQWGPAHFYPLAAATEGAGFPRAFAEVRQVRIGIGALSAQWQFGGLEESGYSQRPPGNRSRWASAATGSLSLDGFPGLSAGATRFFHVRRTDSFDWNTVLLPFSGILKTQTNDSVVGGHNQLASVFVRAAPRGAGVEIYGELYREDHNYDLRDLIGEPDHASAWVLGLRRAWERGGRTRALTLERVNGRFSHITRIRPQAPIYVHNPITEGHTFRGQLLGSVAAMRGAGLAVAWDELAGQESRRYAVEIIPAGQSREGGGWRGQMHTLYVLRAGHALLWRRSVLSASARVEFGATRNVTLTFGRAP